MAKEPTPHLVPCPTCGKQTKWTAKNEFRPFCSRRCRLIDLGAWVDEDRYIPGEEEPGIVPKDIENSDDAPR